MTPAAASLGGPVIRNQVHYFGAYERTQQDTKQVVNTLGLFPQEDGVHEVPFREDLLAAKIALSLSPAHRVGVRYARDANSQPAGAGPRAARSSWR